MANRCSAVWKWISERPRALGVKLPAVSPLIGLPKVGSAQKERERTLSPVDGKAKARYQDPPDPQSRLVRGFAQDRTGGKVEVKEEDGKTALVVTLKAKM